MKWLPWSPGHLELMWWPQTPRGPWIWEVLITHPLRAESFLRALTLATLNRASVCLWSILCSGWDLEKTLQVLKFSSYVKTQHCQDEVQTGKQTQQAGSFLETIARTGTGMGSQMRVYAMRGAEPCWCSLLHLTGLVLLERSRGEGAEPGSGAAVSRFVQLHI